MDSCYSQIKKDLQEVKNKISSIEKQLCDPEKKIMRIDFRIGNTIYFSYDYLQTDVVYTNVLYNTDKHIEDFIKHLHYDDTVTITAYNGSGNTYWLMYITNYLVRELDYELQITSCINCFDFKKKSNGDC